MNTLFYFSFVGAANGLYPVQTGIAIIMQLFILMR